jgi:hypothetical protein
MALHMPAVEVTSGEHFLLVVESTDYPLGLLLGGDHGAATSPRKTYYLSRL